jgi:hypothetical protein
MPQIDPVTGERIQERPAPQIDPATGERVYSGPQITPDIASDSFRAGVHSQMLGVDAGYAYQNREEIERQLRDASGDYDNDKGFLNAAETGFEETPLGMLLRGKAPEPFESTNALERFVHNAVGFAADPVVLVPTIGGAFLGQPELGFVGGSALDAGLRKTMMDHYQKGDVKDFQDLTARAGDALWEATKGAAGAEAFAIAGELPVPGMLAGKPLSSIAMKSAYQAAAITTVGSLMNGQVPRLRDFEDSALMVIPLNLATGGLLLKRADIKQAAMDVYAKDGTTPQETAEKLAAQPPVKPEPQPGLRPAIQVGEGFIEADAGEHHASLAERVLAQKPVTMAELQADPALADDVLQNPAIHDQETIDRAWALKKEALEAGGGDKGAETIDQLYNRAEMKSGRGFVTPDGKFLTRPVARAWMKANEPLVAQMWEDVAGGKNQEFHSEDYAEARNRVHGRDLLEGEDGIGGMSRENIQRLGVLRKGLNDIKAGNVSSGYAKEVLRILYVGQRDTRVAFTNQLRESLQKLLPEQVDQEALTFYRDYKGMVESTEGLRSQLRMIQEGNDAKLKPLIPAIERALNPTKAMLEADRKLTAYYTPALNEGRELGFLESKIPPENYTHRVLVKGEEPGSLGKFTAGRTEKQLLDSLKKSEVDYRTVNALDSMQIYGESHAQKVATKLLEMELKNSELGVQGTEEDHPDGWMPMSDRSSLYVPKVVAEALNPIFEKNVLSKIPAVAKFLHVQAYTKAIELGLSVFHMKALTITAMNNMAFTDFGKALASDIEAPEFKSALREWAADGLKTTKSGHQYEVIENFKPTSAEALSFFDRARELPGPKQMEAIAHWLTHETFDVIQTKFKVMDASLKIARWIAKNPEASNAELFAARRSIAKEVNAAYGGLNFEMMGMGKNAVTLARMVMLAPDWTFSNVASLRYGFADPILHAIKPGTFEGGRQAGAAARAFFFKSAATGFALTAATSMMIGGTYDPKHPEMVQLGGGKSANWFFAGAPKDFITWTHRMINDGELMGTAKFIVGKLGPIGESVIGLAENKQFGGKPITKPDETHLEKDWHQGEYVAGHFVPFTLKNIGEMVMDPKQHSLLEYATAVAGMTTTQDNSTKPSGKKEKGVMSSSKTMRRKRFSIVENR